MQFQMTIRQGLTVLLIAFLLVGCGGKGSVKAEKPADVTIRIKTTDDLNPDINGRASPIILRIYKLKSDDAFSNARFFELYENGEETLGNDLVGQQEFEVSPNEFIELDTFELDVAARYIGFMAAYRDLDRANWRGSIAVPVNTKTFLDVTLDEMTLTVGQGTKNSNFLTGE